MIQFQGLSLTFNRSGNMSVYGDIALIIFLLREKLPGLESQMEWLFIHPILSDDFS